MTRLAASSFDWAIRVNREASPRGDLGASIYWIRHGACNDSMAPYYSEELPMSKRPPTSACAAAASGLKNITASIERKPMDLFLLRHAIAEPAGQAGGLDCERRLPPEGGEQMPGNAPGGKAFRVV